MGRSIGVSSLLLTTGLLVVGCGGQSIVEPVPGEAGSARTSADGGVGGSTGGASSSTGGASGSTGGAGNASGTGGSGSASGAGGSGSASGAGGSGSASGAGGSGGGSTSPGEVCGGLRLEARAAPADAEACAGFAVITERVERDLYFMLERSISLGRTVPGSKSWRRWQGVTDAMRNFVESADPSVRVGMGFFGRSGGNDDGLDCDPALYADPDVAIGTLESVGTELLETLAGIEPGGGAPTGPALAGALEYASAWASLNSTRGTAVVLVSDDYPSQCDDRDVSELAAIASASGARTYVVTLSDGVELEAVSIAGGTGSDIRIDEANFTASLTAELERLAKSCEYRISDAANGLPLDPNRLNVLYRGDDGENALIPRVSDWTACGNGGFYLDDPSAPTQIVMCPCTCAVVEAGSVEAVFGCVNVGPAL